MIKILLALALVISTFGQSSAIPNINTGKVTPITSFSGNSTSSVYYYTVTHTLGAASFQACLALISYDAILSAAFTFNTTILSMNATTLSFSVQAYNTTYFNTLSYHYLLSIHPTLDIKLLCYYTTPLNTGTGNRIITFSNATTSLSGSYLTLTTVLTGFKIMNTQGTSMILRAASTQNNGTISTTITTDGYNVLEWVCVAVVVFNPKTTQVGQFYVKQSASLGYNSVSPTTICITGCINNIATYQIANIQFFGISAFQLSLTQAFYQIFMINTDNFVSYYGSPTLNANQLSIIVQQLFIYYDNCIVSVANMVPLTGSTCTSGCNVLQYQSTTKFCLPCGNQGGNCLNCDSFQCTSCDSTSPVFRIMNTLVSPDICICLTSYFDLNSTCTLCTTYLSNCLQCSSQTTCTVCNTTFVPDNGICVCASGTFLINDTCAPLMGCLSINIVTNAIYCDLCDSTKYFYKVANQTCVCQAHTVYNNVTGWCEGNCSDGASLGNPCDLGVMNGVAGSGCEANCTITAGYFCSSTSSSAPSVCVPIASYSGSYKYVTKQLSSNTANIYVQLSPNDPILAEMDFSSLVTTSIPTSEITCTFDSTTGILLIQATYSQTIEGSSQLLNISFDPTKIQASSVQIYAQLNSVNTRLEFSTFETYNNIILFISMFAGGAAFVFAIVAAILGYKLIGFQLCLPVQITYFTLCFLSVPYSALSALQGLSFSTGYNQLSTFSLLDNLNLDKGLLVIQKTNFFIQNCNYTYVGLLVLLIVALVMRQCVKEKVEEEPKKNSKELKKNKDEKEEKIQMVEEKQPVEVSKGQRAYYFIVDRLLVTVWVLLLLLAVFSFGIQIQTENYNSQHSLNLNIAVALLVLIVELGGFMFIVLKIKQKDRTISFKSPSKYYPLIYVVCQLSVAVVVASTYFITQYAIFIVFIPEIITIIFYLKLAPHGKFKSFVNITGLMIQFVPLIGTSMFILAKYLQIAIIATAAAFMIAGLFLIGFGLSIARLIIKYREPSSRGKQNNASKIKLQAQNLEAMTYSSIKKQLMNNNTERKLNWEAINEAHQSKHAEDKNYEPDKLESNHDESEQDQLNEQEDELKKIKTRLRKQIYQRRNFDLL